MAEARSADARLERLLFVIPAASRKDGATLTELARSLGTSPAAIMKDLEEVTARAYYHPGGWPDDLLILVDADRVRVLHAGGLERPVRLSALETLCLALGLRGSGAAAHLADGEARTHLLRRTEEHLGSDRWTREEPDPVHAEDVVPDAAGIRETLLSAARSHHPCAIVYAKAGADDMDARVIHPYVLALAEGVWYVVGWCAVKEGMRVFRVDRILEAAETDGTFTVPQDFDPDDWLTAARVYRADGDVAVRVRYSPRIARWVRERAAAGASEWEEEPDGSIVIHHRVADPHWVVGHALQYGAEAEILGPEEMRAMLREAVEGMAG